MSTRLTKRNIPMVESKTLQLVFKADAVNTAIGQYLSYRLERKGYKSATPAALNFLSALDCGVNYASEIARNLGVSRQMIAKTVKEFCQLGYLEQVAGTGKQKQILFTELGEQLISDARAILADIDKVLDKQLSKDTLEETINNLTSIHATLVNTTTNEPK